MTASPPTADQIEEGLKGRSRARCPIEVCGFNTLYNRLFDARDFLRLRSNYPFGSVRDPNNDSNKDVPLNEYIEVRFCDRNGNDNITTSEIYHKVKNRGFRGAIIGDYGAGKSMALRHIYFKMSRDFDEGNSVNFPIYLNLRDHFGQTDPSEALIRHATRLGHAAPHRLVSAWRAGYAILILDGFDELSPAQLSSTMRNLRDARRAASILISNLLDESPENTSILCAGRLHYFDDEKEMRSSIGLPRSADVFDIGEFTDKQIVEYLSKRNITHALPIWLPRRPLLIGYLAASGILNEMIESREDSPAIGWDYLLNKICTREVKQISDVAVEPETLRVLLERLATMARSKENGRGPLDADAIGIAFRDAFGQSPNERTQVLLLRLPGLSSVPGSENSREFIDDDLTDACRAGDVVRFVVAPHDDAVDFSEASIELGAIGSQLLASKIECLSQKQISHAAQEACAKNYSYLSLDILKSLQINSKSYDGDYARIVDGYFGFFEIIPKLDFSKIVFSECLFEGIDISTDDGVILSQNFPKFERCVIGTLSGVKGREDLPKGKFDENCQIDRYSGIGSTNAEILDSELPMSVRVLMTILKKTFFQAGGARQEAALYRGLDVRARSYVADILAILQRHGLLRPSTKNGPTLWQAQRDKVSEARAIMEAPVTSKSKILAETREL